MTDKQSEFVRQLVAGKTHRQAYLIAYPKSKKWKPEHVDEQAWKTLKNPKVFQRYKELKDQANEKADLRAIDSRALCINRALDILNADLGEYYETTVSGLDEVGLPVNTIRMKDNLKLDDLETKNIKKITWDSKGRPVLEMHDPYKAMDKLIELLGLVEEKTDSDVNLRIGKDSSDYFV